MLWFSYDASKSILEKKEEFYKKWGSLYSEFKNDKGFFSSQYYLLYFSKRVAFALSLIFLNSYLIAQGTINIFFSIITLIHLLYYRPYKDLSIQISITVSELCMTIVIILSYAFIWELSSDYSKIIETIIIFSVITSILVQMVISFFSFFKTLKILYDKLKNYQESRSPRRLAIDKD